MKTTRTIEWHLTWPPLSPEEAKRILGIGRRPPPALPLRLSFDADLAAHLPMNPHAAQEAIEGMIASVQVIALRRLGLAMNHRREHVAAIHEAPHPAPYWLVDAALRFAEYKSCERVGPNRFYLQCSDTSDCVTEYCAPCAARAWLAEQDQAQHREAAPAWPVHDATVAGEITDAHGQRWRPCGPGEYEPVDNPPQARSTEAQSDGKHDDSPGPETAGRDAGQAPPEPAAEQRPPAAGGP